MSPRRGGGAEGWGLGVVFGTQHLAWSEFSRCNGVTLPEEGASDRPR